MLPKQERTEPMLSADVEAEGLWSAKDVENANLVVHEIVDFRGCASWNDVESCLKQASNTKLKEMLQRKGNHDIPSSKPPLSRLFCGFSVLSFHLPSE